MKKLTKWEREELYIDAFMVGFAIILILYIANS